MAGAAPALQCFHRAIVGSHVVGQADRLPGADGNWTHAQDEPFYAANQRERILTMSGGRREARAAAGRFRLRLRLRCHLRRGAVPTGAEALLHKCLRNSVSE
jgi:hypothetical protein